MDDWPHSPYEWALLAESALCCAGLWKFLHIPRRRGDGMASKLSGKAVTRAADIRERALRRVDRALDRVLGPYGRGRTCGHCAYWRYVNRDCDPLRPDRRTPFGHLGICGYYELPCATEVPWGWRRYEPGKSIRRARKRACARFKWRKKDRNWTTAA